MPSINRISSSYKDPAGFVFILDKDIYRQVNLIYKSNYDLLINSGLYKKLTENSSLIAHVESDLEVDDTQMYKIIKPTLIPFISYPYEWSFSQLKDAALLTLGIQRKALLYGMSLKDASAYNIQFFEGKPIFIDTLSFEVYSENKPWVAYKQFCEHFLAPLALLAYTDIRLTRFSQIYIDGIPLDLASKLLSWRAKIKPSLFIHIFLHALKQNKYSDSSLPAKKNIKFNQHSLLAILDNLEDSVKNIKLKIKKTTWSNYCSDDDCESYENASLQAKKNIVSNYLDQINSKNLWDIGSNTGLYSRLAANKGISVISMDFDEMAVEINYLRIKKSKEKKILPLIIDVVNPSPSIGWHNEERDSIMLRSFPDAVLALALVHHLAISKNLPFHKIANYFAEITQSLIIEFVPKDDRQVQRLLRSREDIYTDYDSENFEKQFGIFFIIKEKKLIQGSKRYLYLMQKK